MIWRFIFMSGTHMPTFLRVNILICVAFFITPAIQAHAGRRRNGVSAVRQLRMRSVCLSISTSAVTAPATNEINSALIQYLGYVNGPSSPAHWKANLGRISRRNRGSNRWLITSGDNSYHDNTLQMSRLVHNSTQEWSSIFWFFIITCKSFFDFEDA